MLLLLIICGLLSHIPMCCSLPLSSIFSSAPSPLLVLIPLCITPSVVILYTTPPSSPSSSTWHSPSIQHHAISFRCNRWNKNKGKCRSIKVITGGSTIMCVW